MNQIEAIEQRRAEVLKQMSRIGSLKRGSITEQYLKVRSKGQPQAVLRGPYYVFSRREGGRTVSRRLTTERDLAQAREEVSAAHRFRELCREYEELTERLGALERGLGEGTVEKKRLRRRSSSRRR
jgi:hypothetical protein